MDQSGRLFSLNLWHVFGLILYAMIFPLSQAVGGAFAEFGLFLVLPFLPLGYVIGAWIALLFGAPGFFPLGMTIGLFFQAWLFLVLVLGGERRRKRYEKRHEKRHAERCEEIGIGQI